MGLFGKFAYSAGRWSSEGPTAVPFLLVDVHDGDVVTVDYRMADASGSRFFLGYEPGSTSRSRTAATRVDAAAEAEGFARGSARPRAPRPIRARWRGCSPRRRARRPSDEVVDETVAEMLALAGLPDPEWPTDEDAPPG